MKPKIIKNEEKYQEMLQEVEKLLALNPPEGTEEAEQLDLLSLLVEQYEKEHYPILPQIEPVGKALYFCATDDKPDVVCPSFKIIDFSLVEVQEWPHMFRNELYKGSGLSLRVSIGSETAIISGREARMLAKAVLQEWMPKK